MRLNKTMYEIKPYFCIALSVAGVVLSPGSKAAGLFSIVLLGCSLLILMMRYEYRKALKQTRN